jgi:hypothetical protein
MANVFTGNPFVVDTAWTAGTIPAGLTAQSGNGPQTFRKIVWSGGTAADVLTITDINGNVLFSEVCPVTGQDVVLWDNNATKYTLKQSQWVVTSIPHGKLLLYK